MAKVICRLPNASSEINGVKFVTHKLGVISEEISDDVALEFAAIQGYVIHDPKASTSSATAPEKPAGGGGTPPAGSTASQSPTKP
jgi:hypothetical protein